MISIKKYSLLISTILLLTFNNAIVHASTYITDSAHTSIGFNVKYLMITDVFGQFKTYDAKVEIVDIKGSNIKKNLNFPVIIELK